MLVDLRLSDEYTARLVRSDLAAVHAAS